VPATHDVAVKLPAVSGSSGRLVVERPTEVATERTWPGQVFADSTADYAAAMRAFVAASAAPARPPTPAPEGLPARQDRAARRVVRQQEAALRDRRRQVRAHRRQEDAAWRAVRRPQRTGPAPPPPAGPHRPRPATRAERQAAVARRRALRAARRADVERRQQEDAAWRAERQSLRERLTGLSVVTAWIAVLVITDNCTRQCLGLPLFVAGPKVTADLIVAALRALLPDDLQFLISDRGVHFTAQVFEAMAREHGFVQVVIARHRPESNGIAERFVRTLKAWLADTEWTAAGELAAPLDQFRAEYNDRPHQGLGLPGLSPNEFADRIWLF